jgi:hypothetical protein
MVSRYETRPCSTNLYMYNYDGTYLGNVRREAIWGWISVLLKMQPNFYSKALVSWVCAARTTNTRERKRVKNIPSEMK